MKKLFYFSAMTLSISMFIYSCEKEEFETKKNDSKKEFDAVSNKSNQNVYVYKEFEDDDWDCVSGKGLCVSTSAPVTPVVGILDDLTNADDEAVIDIFIQGEEELLEIVSVEEYEKVIGGVYNVRMNGTIDDSKIAMIFTNSQSENVRVYSIEL